MEIILRSLSLQHTRHRVGPQSYKNPLNSLRAEKKEANKRFQFMTEKLSDAKTFKDFDLKLKNRFELRFDKASCLDKLDEIQRRSDDLNNALQTTIERTLGKREKSNFSSIGSILFFDI